MSAWMFDAFFWLVVPVAIFEALRVVHVMRRREQRWAPRGLAYGGLELALLTMCAATGSPLLFVVLSVLRIAIIYSRERQWWGRRIAKAVLFGTALVLLAVVGDVSSFAQLSHVTLDPDLRLAILVLICAAAVAATVPVRVVDEPKETLSAPLAFIVFARVALPLGASTPQFAIVVPVVAAALSLVCALWLLSAGTRANHFDPSVLVSEIILCERGVLLSFVWLGLATGEHLSGVGALLQWAAGVLALLALEASLRRRPLPRPMAFFALAMAVSLPGTIGFVAEDLLAHGLLELHPLLAAAFVIVAAINAAALYLALVNIIVDLQARQTLPGPTLQPEGRPSFMMLATAGLSLVIGLVPSPFVTGATRAYAAVVGGTGRTN